MEKVSKQVRKDVATLKDLDQRQFQALTRNFYLMRSALRYFVVKQGLSFTSSKVAGNFPMTVSTAGSCLKALEDLGVVESRTSSRKRFLPQDTDMDRLMEVGEVLRQNFEIDTFTREEANKSGETSNC